MAKGRNRGSGGGGRYHKATTAAAEPVYPDEVRNTYCQVGGGGGGCPSVDEVRIGSG